MRRALLAAVRLSATLTGCSDVGKAKKALAEVEQTKAELAKVQTEILILPGAGGVNLAGAASPLTPQDADAIGRECTAIHSAAPVIQVRTQIAVADKNWTPLYLYGTTPAYLDVREWQEIAEGATFTVADLRSAACVCLIGQTVKRELFDDRSPIGQEIRIQGVGFKVVGVLGARGANAMGLDFDDVLLAPWTTINARLRIPDNFADDPKTPRFTPVDKIHARARSDEEVPCAIREITDLLRRRHHIKAGQPDDFNIRDWMELAKALGTFKER